MNFHNTTISDAFFTSLKMNWLAATSLLLGSFSTTKALDVGVARLPVLGYNTWNAYQCNIDENLILDTAKLMQSLGLQDAGYNYVNIDDCYSEKNRTSEGLIIADKKRFKSGMRTLTDKLHKMNFKAGIYSSAGWTTCAGYPASYGNEYVDAKTFHEDWGFDYLKYDNCAIPYDNVTRTGIVGRYERMADAIGKLAKKTKKTPMVYSLCNWGWNEVWLWGKYYGQSWRTTGDIAPHWNSLMNIVNFNSFITQATDFYGRNDLDMLQIGNGNLTYEETKAHFTVWAFNKSPLFIGTNLSAITPETLGVLKNKEVLAINQDPVYGESLTPFRWGINPDRTSNSTHPAQYWSGRTSYRGGGVVFMMLNTLDHPAEMTFNITESPWTEAGKLYEVRDLWSHTNNGTALRNVTTIVPAHGVSALLLKEGKNEPDGVWPPCSVWWQCTSQTGERLPGA